MLSTRTTSRLASVCPSASMRVFSRARIRSPRPARLPSASVISASPTRPSSARRSRTRAGQPGRGLVRRGHEQGFLAVQEAVQVQRHGVVEYPVLRAVVDPAAPGVLGQGGDVPLPQLQRGLALPRAGEPADLGEPVGPVPRGDQAGRSRPRRPRRAARGRTCRSPWRRYRRAIWVIRSASSVDTCVASSTTRTSPG